MPGKFASFMSPCKIRRWVCSIKSFSSISGAVLAETCPESYQKLVNKAEIDPKIQYLKRDLCPDNLIRVLDNTHDLNSALRVFKWVSLQKQFRHTVSTYSSIIYKLGFAGNVDEMEGFCREMVKDKCRGAEEALFEVLDVFLSNCRLDEAMRVVLVMNFSGFKLCLGKWNCVLSALVNGKRSFRDVVLMYKEMVKSGTLPDVDTLNNLIKSLFDANMVDEALGQFRRMGKKRCVPTCRTYDIVICGLVASDRVDESLCVMNEMFADRVNPDSSFCNNVIPLFAKENKLEEAMKLFTLMKTLQYEPDVSTYEALIKVLCLNTRFKEATELSDQMRKSGFSTSADVLVDLLNAYCKLGKLDEGRSLLDESQVIDPSPYNIMLQGYCDTHQFLAAKDLLQRMLRMNVVYNLSWNILIQGLCNAKYVSEAREVLGKMIISSYVPDSAAYSALVTGKCDLGEYEDALDLFIQVRERDWILDPSSYAELMKGLCKLEKLQEATEVFMYMSVRNSTLPSSIFTRLVEGFCATARVDEAIRVLKFGQYHGNAVTTSAFTSILQYLFKLNRPYDGLLLLPQVLRRGLVLDTEAYCILIQCMIALCQTKYCILFLNLMVSEDLVPNHETLASLLPHFANNFKLQTIFRSIIKICQKSQVIDSDMYNLLISGLCQEGCKTEACQLLDCMLERGWVPDASTHSLLIGSSDRQSDQQTMRPNSSGMQDEVDSILSESLGED